MKANVGSCSCAIYLDIASRNQDDFTVKFILRQKFIFLISTNLFEFEAYTNSLDHLDCSHGVLAVFIIIFCTSGSKFISPSMKAVVETCTGAISLDHLDFRLFMFGSYSRNKDKFTVNFISRQKLIFLVFEEAVRIRSLCKFS